MANPKTKKSPARKKLVLQKRKKDTIVYVRMKPPMWTVFEEAYAKHCEENMLNPQSYGMSTFVRENAFANLKSLGAV
jgi:glutamate/tyrosine decarboxylase-like PLP-dependent enzyme